ncbi:MAG: hypothetical protein IH975_05625 [Nitrospinae bacterium]|nr:hypothetical protein [Nitrospinota bacterium]
MSEEGFIPQSTLTTTAYSRPKRVAFLINPEETNDKELNQIIRYNDGVWGGRFNAIIPTTGTEIAPDWWKLLAIVDPDIIYSLLPLSDDLVYRINRKILPAKIIEVMPDDRERLGEDHLIREFRIGALGIEDIPRFIWETRGSIREPFFFYIKDSYRDSSDRTFVLRNFGALPGVAVFDTSFRDVPHEILESGASCPIKIMERLLPYGGNAVVPHDLCRMYATHHYSLQFDPFTRGFHLIIGDSPLDAIYAWNRALTSDLRWGGDVFWLPQEFSQDDKLLNTVGEWIRETFWATNHDRQGKVISYSLEEDQLQTIAQNISGLTQFYFKPVKLTHNQFPCPDTQAPVQIPERHTAQVPLSGGRGLLGFPRPPFLVKGHPQTGWMVDLEIQFRPEPYIHISPEPIWKLPKRLGLAGKFLPNSHESRVINGGVPSVAVTTADQVIKIQVPPDRNIFFTYMERFQTNSPFGRHPQPASQFEYLNTSDKGRYLQGLLRLFKGVYGASRFFEDPFWRDVFHLMAGRPDPDDDFQRRKKLVHETLTDLIAEDPTSIHSDSPRLDQLTDELARRLQLRDPEPKILTKKNITNRFGEIRGKVLQAQPDNEWWQVNEKFDEWKERELTGLLEDKVLLQGTELSCPDCGTRQWYVVDDLSSEMRCNGCLSTFPLPPTPKWSFRLNDLVSNALRKHGTLAVLQALYAIQREYPMGMFLFLPCQDIFEKDKKDPFTDLDLVGIKDGKFFIGEVKSTPGGFKPSDFETLKIVAEDLVPDVVVVAAQGEEWPAEVAVQIEELRDELKQSEIEVEDILLQWR